MHKINLQQAVDQLNQEELLIYPTETVYGLGCRVDSQLALTKLLNFKPRSTGFIILVTSWEQALLLLNIQIDTAQLFKQEPTTWVFPSSTKTPKQLCNSKGEIAIRKIDFEPTKTLIESLGCPLVSTSANKPGMPTARTDKELTKLAVPVMSGSIGNQKPSTIIHYLSKEILRP